MISLRFSTVLFSLLYIVVTVSSFLTNTVYAFEKVNCRRVVFHPYCRGISAKRANLQMEEDNTYQNSEEIATIPSPYVWKILQLQAPGFKYDPSMTYNDFKKALFDHYVRQNKIPPRMFIMSSNPNPSKETSVDYDKTSYYIENSQEPVAQPPYMLRNFDENPSQYLSVREQSTQNRAGRAYNPYKRLSPPMYYRRQTQMTQNPNIIRY